MTQLKSHPHYGTIIISIITIITASNSVNSGGMSRNRSGRESAQRAGASKAATRLRISCTACRN